MNNLVWKLLRQHISIGQLTGFFFANLFGMVIVLLSAQFYKDVVPIFTEGDSFMKKDYMTATKKISTLGSFAGKSNTFSSEEIEELKKQPFTRSVGAFTPSQFKVSAGLGMQEAGIHLSTEMFFEAVPDKFVDVSLDKWHFDEGVGRTNQSHNADLFAAREDGNFDGICNNNHRDNCKNDDNNTTHSGDCTFQIRKDGSFFTWCADIRINSINFQKLLFHAVQGCLADIF